MTANIAPEVAMEAADFIGKEIIGKTSDQKVAQEWAGAVQRLALVGMDSAFDRAILDIQLAAAVGKAGFRSTDNAAKAHRDHQRIVCEEGVNLSDAAARVFVQQRDIISGKETSERLSRIVSLPDLAVSADALHNDNNINVNNNSAQSAMATATGGSGAGSNSGSSSVNSSTGADNGDNTVYKQVRQTPSAYAEAGLPNECSPCHVTERGYGIGILAAPAGISKKSTIDYKCDVPEVRVALDAVRATHRQPAARVQARPATQVTYTCQDAQDALRKAQDVASRICTPPKLSK